MYDMANPRLIDDPWRFGGRSRGNTEWPPPCRKGRSPVPGSAAGVSVAIIFAGAPWARCGLGGRFRAHPAHPVFVRNWRLARSKPAPWKTLRRDGGVFEAPVRGDLSFFLDGTGSFTRDWACE